MTTRKTRRKAPTEAHRFVSAWQRAASLKEVEAATGMTRAKAIHRAYAYRKKGIPLKMMPRGRPPMMDVASLVALAKRLARSAR